MGCVHGGALAVPGWEGGRAEKQRTWGSQGWFGSAAGGVSLSRLEADPDTPAVWLRERGCSGQLSATGNGFPVGSDPLRYPLWGMGTSPFPCHGAKFFRPTPR